MKSQLLPIFPEPIVEYRELGVDRERMETLYARQEWKSTNADDCADYFLQIGRNLKVLDDERDLQKIFVDIVNQYTTGFMKYENEFYMTTSWFTRTEANKISVLHNHGNAMFSAVYYARTLKYEMGRTEHFPIYENGKNLEVGLTPIGREVVTTGVGAFQCWKLKLSLRINNVLSPTGDVFLWLSDDHKKYVVKFEAAIKIGSLNGLLTEIRERK